MLKRLSIELIIILSLSLGVYFISAEFDLFENTVMWIDEHEEYELDEWIPTGLFLMFALGFFSLSRWRDQRKLNRLIETRNKELEDALHQIDQLNRLLPICSVCKKIRDDEGYWHQVENYIHEHTGSEFSHSLCPQCLEKTYPNRTPTPAPPKTNHKK